MSREEQRKAVKEAADAIRNAVEREDANPEDLDLVVTEMQRVGRGSNDRRRTDKLNLLIAIEGFLYDSDIVGHRKQITVYKYNIEEEKLIETARAEGIHRKKVSEKGYSYYTEGTLTKGKDRKEIGISYKKEDDIEKNAKLIEEERLNVADEVYKFLQDRKEKKSGEEGERQLSVGSNQAQGLQMILRADDITEKEVSNALKEIASNLTRLREEKEAKQKAKEFDDSLNDLLAEAMKESSVVGETNSINGDDNDSVKSQPVRRANQSEPHPVENSEYAGSVTSEVSDEDDLNPLRDLSKDLIKREGSVTSEISDEDDLNQSEDSIEPEGSVTSEIREEDDLNQSEAKSSVASEISDEDEDGRVPVLNKKKRVQVAIKEDLSLAMKVLNERYAVLSQVQERQTEIIKAQEEELRVLREELEKHIKDPKAHQSFLTRGVTLGGSAGVGLDYSEYLKRISEEIAKLATNLKSQKIEDADLLEELEEIRKEMMGMSHIQLRQEKALLAAKELAEDAEKAAKQRDLKAKERDETLLLAAKELAEDAGKAAKQRDSEAKKISGELEALSKETKARDETLSEELGALRKQTADHQEAEKKAREEKEARELAEKARVPLRISKDELNALGHYKNDLDEAGKAHTVKIPEISGRIRESDKTMELYESGLSVAIYDFGKRGLTYLGHDVDAAGNAAADRESMMTIARVINPKGDGDSEDVYCVISSSPERGMSTTYISKNTFDDIALKSRKEYDNAALATAKLVELENALKVLEAGRDKAYAEMGPSIVDDGNFSEDGDGNFSEDGDGEKARIFSEDNARYLDYKIKALRKVIEDAEISLKPESTKAEADRVKREAALKILSDYQSGIRKVFETLRNYGGIEEDWKKQIENAKNNIKTYSGDGLRDLHGKYQRRLLALDLPENQIDEILGSDDLINSLYLLEPEKPESFDNFGEKLQRSQKIVEDLYPTRSHALKRAAQYSLEREFGDLMKFRYQDAAGNQQSFLTAEQGAALKSAMAESSDTEKCLKKLTIVQKDNARRIASTEFSRNAAREIEMANKDKLDFNEFEKEAATAQLVQHWKSNRFFTGSNALASKETDIKEFFEKAKMSDGPYPGPQVTRPNRRNDMATVVFNGVNRFDPKSEAGYEGDNIMYLHVRGTLAPNALYVRVWLATAENDEIPFFRDGKECPNKICQMGDIVIDESTVYTKDSLGNHNPKGVSSLGRGDQSLCKNFKVKAMSVIDGERKTAILFEGVPITPQNGLAKAAQVQEVPVIPLHQCTPLVSLVTKKKTDKKGKETSDGGIYVQDASDPNKPPVLTGPLIDDARLVAELHKHGVPKSQVPPCEELKKKMNLPKSVATSTSLGTSKLLNTTIRPFVPPAPPPRAGGGRC